MVGSLSFHPALLIPDLDVTVISPRPHFVFTPLLAGCAVGTLEFRSTLEPVSYWHTRRAHALIYLRSRGRYRGLAKIP
jgi:NADH dehydrogenase FAD-containing subunit